jgi:DNA-binding CsgD family transcriptional regulator
MSQFEYNGEHRELLVGEIYRSVLGVAPLRHALRELALQTGSDKAFWGTFDAQQSAAQILDAYNAAPDFIEKYNSTLPARDVWFSKAQYYQAEGLIWRGSRIVPLEDLTSTRFFSDFLAPQQIYHTLHIVIMVSPGKVTRVLLTRPEHEPDFSDKDLETARCFAFHARQALESYSTLAGQTMVRAGLAEVITDAALGVAIVDPPTVIYTTKVCDRILASLGAPSAIGNGGSRAISGVVHFPRAVAEAINAHKNGAVRRLIVSTPNQDRDVLVSIKAVFYRNPAHFEKRLLVVSFFDLSQNVPIDDELLQSTYDLTASEIRICALLANGESVESVSEKLGISPNTARTHIKRIFSKTGAARQSELVKLMMNTATLHRNVVARTVSEGSDISELPGG